MISILIGWCIIGIYSYLYGRTVISILYKEREHVLKSVDIAVVSGFVFLNIFAQFFSIVYKVGMFAFVVVSVGAIVCLFYLWKKDILAIRTGQKHNAKMSMRTILTGVAIIGTLLWTNVVPQHYDTYLYHAQAIHWIEEYAVVPGLGNLHFRLAYNSAFMTLQALFSFAWLNGQSMHIVNGFIVLSMMIYGVCTFHRNERELLQVSDFLKIGMIFYLLYTSIYISSPNTDICALLLLFYVCIKWSEFSEQEISSALPYSFLSLLCVYAVTVKLSVAIFVILVIYPAWLLLQRKQWNIIVQHLLIGIVIAVPYFIRNYFISGYLIYPYPEIDLFQVDWKMSETIMLTDRKEITVWARGNKDISRYQETIGQWFGDWFLSIHLLWRILFIFSIIAVVYLLWNVIRYGSVSKLWNKKMLMLTCIIGEIFWLFSAPLPRYGIAYMLFVLCIFLGLLFRKVCKGATMLSNVCVRLGRKVGCISLICSIFLYGVLYFAYSDFVYWGKQTLVWQNDYDDRDTTREILDGKEIFRAAQGDQTGYNPFPTTPYGGVIEELEFRGMDFEHGFRIRTN